MFMYLNSDEYDYVSKQFLFSCLISFGKYIKMKNIIDYNGGRVNSSKWPHQ